MLYISKDPKASSLYCHPLFSAVGVFAYGIHQREASASVLVNSALFLDALQSSPDNHCRVFLLFDKIKAEFTADQLLMEARKEFHQLF